MRQTIAAALLCTALGACSTLHVDEGPTMPLNPAGGPTMTQNDAIGLSSYALKEPANTHGDPATAARAIAAEDWLAHQWLLTPDFGEYQPANQVQWVEFRREVRQAIGVPPGTPSQVVIDRLLAASDALKAGNRTQAAAQLQPPTFALGPDATLAALSNLPAFSDWSWAYSDLQRNENRISGCPSNSSNC